MVLAWLSLDRLDTSDDARFEGDPAELIDALEALREAIRRPAWHRQAACRGQGTSAWFPSRGESVEVGKEVCAGCPVAAECLTAGMGERHGIWGGSSERGRRELRRRPAGDHEAA
jgi:WhiB family redox-sensing transcriptional regulator